MFIKYKDEKDTIQDTILESPMIEYLQDVILKSKDLQPEICE